MNPPDEKLHTAGNTDVMKINDNLSPSKSSLSPPVTAFMSNPLRRKDNEESVGLSSPSPVSASPKSAAEQQSPYPATERAQDGVTSYANYSLSPASPVSRDAQFDSYSSNTHHDAVERKFFENPLRKKATVVAAASPRPAAADADSIVKSTKHYASRPVQGVDVLPTATVSEDPRSIEGLDTYAAVEEGDVTFGTEELSSSNEQDGSAPVKMMPLSRKVSLRHSPQAPTYLLHQENSIIDDDVVDDAARMP